MYSYEPCEEFVIINDDPDLSPGGEGIKLDILDIIQRTYKSFGSEPPTELPPYENMYNFGLPIEDQIFHKEIIPQKLQSLEKHIRQKERANKRREQTPIKIELNSINNFWEELETHQDDYREEIAWLEKIWYHRLYGAWYIIQGKPIYFPGCFFFYVNFVSIPKATSVQYRDRDRRFSIAYQWSKLETRTFVDLDKDGIAIPNSEGNYDMLDLDIRVFYGILSAKPRRVGDTSKSACYLLEECTRSIEKHYGIQAESENSSEKVFLEHIMFQFKRYPIFFKPLHDAIDPKSDIAFKSDNRELSLDSWIDYATSKKSVHYDGSGLAWYLGDEVGKCEGVDIVARHRTIRLACSERSRIDGNIVYCSTVEDMTLESGVNFLKLCKQSKFHQRTGSGQTQTGMLSLYFRASDAYPGYIDDYGYSIEKNPTPYQKEFLKRHNKDIRYGAFDYLMQTRKGLTEEDLSSEKRQNPLNFREIFTPPAGNNIFPMDRMEKRVTDLRFGKPLTRSFSLSWVDGFGGKVGIIFPPEGQEGRFIASYIPEKHEQNRWIKRNGIQYPENADKFILTADAFRLDNVNGTRLSKGGIAMRLKRDHTIDPDDKPIEKWQTAKQILYYSYRPSTVQEFCEDVLKACIFYGSLAFNENNLNVVNDFFIKNDFDGYLLYDTDSYGDFKVNAGYMANAVTKQNGFNLIRDDLNMHVERFELEPLLVECMTILGIADMTNFDGFSAYLGNLLGEKSCYGSDLNGKMNEKFDISGFYNLRTY